MHNVMYAQLEDLISVGFMKVSRCKWTAVIVEEPRHIPADIYNSYPYNAPYFFISNIQHAHSLESVTVLLES